MVITRSTLLFSLIISAALGIVSFSAQSGSRMPLEAPPAGAVPHADRGDAHFSQDWHAGRRKALVESIKKGITIRDMSGGEKKIDGSAAGVIFLRGAPERRDYQRFRQTNEFFYLTGLEAPGAALVINIANGKEVLFLAPPSQLEELQFDDIRPHAPSTKTNKSHAQAEGEKLLANYKFNDFRNTRELQKYLKSLAAEGVFYVCHEPEEYEATSRDEAADFEAHQEKDPFDGRTSRTLQLRDKLVESLSVKISDLSPFLDDLRRIKTTEEIEAMRIASKIAAAGHIAAMRATKPGLKEWQVAGEATAVFYRMGAPAISYFPIFGTGRNALTLHYTNVGATIARDDVILMDYAPEWRYYASDVTRSWPASGKFTEKGKKIYEAVLKAQEAAIAKVRPGATFMEVNMAAMQSLVQSGFPPIPYMPHGLSHSIGMSTHDVCGIGPVLEAGEVFTIEPGIYDKESSIGVRIEDVIAVTKDGYDNLSKDAPKTVAAIEAIVGKR
ncbi:MAG: aminopeptidase P N-terminal domain-containing protein [Planctomycetota bacterium]